MHFDLRAMDSRLRYRIIGGCIIPRPIAWVTSLSVEGVPNVAPFSFFNAIGNDPPTIVLGMVAHAEQRLKDTPANIRATGEFVVNLVSANLAQAMNKTSAAVPSNVDEGLLAGLDLTPSIAVAPPRITASPVSLECRLSHFVETGPYQVAVLAEVLHAHVRDEFVLYTEKVLLNVPAMNLIARLHGAGWYSRQTDMFEMLRPD